MHDLTPAWTRVDEWTSVIDELANEREGWALWAVQRYKFEAYRMRGCYATEVRIPCGEHGEMYPVGPKRWGWLGPGGYWAKRVVRLLGDDAKTQFFAGVMTVKECGTKQDELPMQVCADLLGLLVVLMFGHRPERLV